MQRRAAAIYGAIFLVLALGAYGMIAAASPPAVSVSDPDYSQGPGSQFSVDGQSYDVTVEEERATISWTVQEAEYTETWAPDDQVALGGTNYTVSIPEGAEPPVVELTEVRPLPDGVETTELNGTEYAVLEGDDGTRELVPLEQYLNEEHGIAEVRTLQGAQVFDYRGNRTRIASVTNSSVELAWTAPRSMTEDVAEGDVVELSGQEFVAHFPAADRLVLDRDVQAYEAQLSTIETYDERINGLWGIVILSALSVLTLLAASSLPSRY